MPSSTREDVPDVAEGTGALRHEPGRTAVPVVLIPRTLLNDYRLSIGARGLASIAVARGGSYRLDPEWIDEVSELLEAGYAVLEGPLFSLTPVAGWSA